MVSKKRLKKPHDSRVNQEVVVFSWDAKDFMEGSTKCRRRSSAISDPQSAPGRTIITMAVTMVIGVQGIALGKTQKPGPILARHTSPSKLSWTPEYQVP